MPRVSSACARHYRHKKLLRYVRGFIGRRKNCYRIAKQAYIKAHVYARRDRRARRARYKQVCVRAINFYLRVRFLVSYSKFIYKLRVNSSVNTMVLFMLMRLRLRDYIFRCLL